MADLENDWNMALPTAIPTSEVAEERIIAALSVAIATWLFRAPEALMGKLYRLDISEPNLQQAFKCLDPAHEIAKYVYKRQCEKIIARASNAPEKDMDTDLAW